VKEDNKKMNSVRVHETTTERVAHLLDDAFHVPGSRIRFGLDPLIGLLPIIGDVIVTAWGAHILVIARRLGVPISTLSRMGVHLLINGVIGSIPVFGDVFSFVYKCHAKNTALLLRQVKQGQQGSCDLVPPTLGYREALIVVFLIVPIIASVGFAGLWLWKHDISFVSLLFPPPYQSRTSN
jgi:hypothetical protein